MRILLLLILFLSFLPQPLVAVEAKIVAQYYPLPYRLPLVFPEITNVNMLLVGDMMLGRYVETLMHQHGDEYPFEKISELLKGHDIVIGNLEGPITQQHSQTPNNVMSFSFQSSIAELLAKYNFTAVSLANNHTYDKGTDNFHYTQEVLRDAEVIPFGSPVEETQEYVETIDANGYKLNLIGFHTATRNNFDIAAAIDTVQQVQSDETIDVVMVHWGNEYQLHSNAVQQTLAHQLIDVGADMIVSHHPHVVQEIELYKDRLIFYSLGNFIFDQYFSKDTEEGLAVSVELQPDQMNYTLIPLESNLSQPSIMNETEQAIWLQDLASRSDEELQEQIIRGVIMQKK